MKQLHRNTLYGWSEFNTERNIDFHGLLWVRPTGNLMVDPVSLSAHDYQHLQKLGGVQWIIITNSDHIRDSLAIAEKTGAQLAGPQAEKEAFPVRCDHWLAEGDQLISGLDIFEMQGSKTPGELALLIENDTLVTGDLIRAHQGGSLCLLPDPKLSDKAQAIESVSRLQQLPNIVAVLPGDGWPVFRDGPKVLSELLSQLT